MPRMEGGLAGTTYRLRAIGHERVHAPATAGGVHTADGTVVDFHNQISFFIDC